MSMKKDPQPEAVVDWSGRHMCVLASCDPVAWQRHFNLHDVAGHGVLEVKDLPVRGICTRCSFANPKNRFGLEVAILLLHLGGCVLVSFNGKSRTLEGRAMDRFTILTWVASKRGSPTNECSWLCLHNISRSNRCNAFRCLKF